LYGCKTSMCQVAVATKFCTTASIICGSSIWLWLASCHPGVSRWLLDFRKFCTALFYCNSYSHLGFHWKSKAAIIYFICNFISTQAFLLSLHKEGRRKQSNIIAALCRLQSTKVQARLDYSKEIKSWRPRQGWVMKCTFSCLKCSWIDLQSTEHANQSLFDL